MHIPISKPDIDEHEIKLVYEVLKSNMLTSSSFEGGKYVRAFEDSLKTFTNARYAIAVNNGTSALYASLLALSIKQGDEVIIPSLTFVATANAIVAAGAKPIFADINLDNYTIDVYDIESKITNKTKAIIPVHIYGHTANMDEILELASKHSLYVIEDACQSLGSIYKGKHTGTIGDIGCYSLYPSKVITSGEGGAIVTNSKELADRCKMIRNHGMLEGYDTRILGLNLRMSEIHAAIAYAQMQKLDRLLSIRRDNAMLMSELLNTKVKIPREDKHSKYNWYLYTILLDNRDFVLDRLNRLGIGATVYYKTPVHKVPFYDNGIRLRNTEYVARHVLSLPIHQGLSKDGVEYIARVILDLIK